MSRSIVSLILVTLLLVTAVAVAAAAPGVNEADVLKGLAAVRQATQRYHDVDLALADGYIAVTPCIEEPGAGAMGIHFLNENLLGDLTVDLEQPELLLYMPSGNGHRLVGVEYFVVALANTDGGPMPWFDHEPPPGGFLYPAPELLGHTFHGPMEGHGPDMPWHYDFHVWAWQANPAGIFADFNPSLGCGG